MAKRVGKQALQDRLSRSFRRIPAEDVPRLFRLTLAEIEPSPDQPRKHIDQDGLRELAASIERHGLIQPITVKRRDDGRDGYVLVAGERRFRAHEMLGREEILAIVTQGAADEIALIENIQRQDLHPLEEAAAYARMMQAHGWTQEQLAEAVGKARPTVTNTLKLNGLADSIKAECAQRGDVSKSLLFEIARQDDVRAQEQLWARVRGGGTVRHARVVGTSKTAGGPKEARSGDTLIGLAASGRRFLKQLVAAEAEARRVDDALRKEIAVLRHDLEGLLRKLGGAGASKPSG
jgi:ParB family transcriptional regulator, chromosome partitioning protein